jgi:hypothetical protein
MVNSIIKKNQKKKRNTILGDENQADTKNDEKMKSEEKCVDHLG